MRALLGEPVPPELTGVRRWLQEGKQVLETLPPGASVDEAARFNALAQLRNTLSYPLLRQKVESGTVRLHAWFYDVGGSELLEWNEVARGWFPLGTGARPHVVLRTRNTLTELGS
jgi:carbonic anhydrase